ncbi:DUF1080 domain-containing protein [Mariniphaga sediminis]|uniref:DUF1080 domain-containing protein n=1 Tax=Mariniphaga sediminis TaxID=1628158 RepID=A0A399D0A6_9BACT|nr:DUF1080 domain-containing protein [Mariniphaga sediminis]RIH65445.1 DUF1080 domain-containing protein [Mariniphaga sediminis]
MVSKHILLSIVLLCSIVIPGCNEDGWEYLFNGKNLEGWKQLGGVAKFEVINGEIVGTTVLNTPNTFLTTEKLYSDFILEVEFILSVRMNSGIQFRSESYPEYNNGVVHGYQCEVDPSERSWSGGIFDESRRSWLYPVDLNPDAKSAFKIGEWNKFRIECIGSSMRTWLNGIPVAHLIDDMTPEGFIALQVHSIRDNKEHLGRQIKWRNIRIKTKNLVPSPPDNIYIVNLIPNDLNPSEVFQGYKLLFDGETTDGWESFCKDSIYLDRWVAEDGVLSYHPEFGSKKNNIATVENYNAFDLKFDFNLSAQSESGIIYRMGKVDLSKGLEYQLFDDLSYSDEQISIDNGHACASLFGLIPAKYYPWMNKKPGTWNQGRIILSADDKVQHWLNGRKVVEYDLKDGIVQDLVTGAKPSIIKDFMIAKESPVILQASEGVVAFRSIKIRRL